MTWRDIGVGGSCIALGLFLGLFLEWRGCGLNGQPGADTVTVHDTVSLPPATVMPNPVQMVYVHDIEAERQADSLMRVVSDRDSLLRELLLPKRAEQRFETESPEGIRVTGHVFAHVMPLSGNLFTRVELDSIAIPVKIITRVETRDVIAFEWIIGAAAAGVITGVLISQ